MNQKGFELAITKYKYEEDILAISDLHVGPNNRRTLGVRGYGADWISHMNFVRDNINSVVKSQSILYILGDLGFKDDTKALKDFLKSLRCRKKVAKGNHDSDKQLKKLHEEGVLEDYKDNFTIKYRDEIIFMSHYPYLEWPKFFDNSIHLYGHCHGNFKNNYRSLDVGIDSIGYTPVKLSEVIYLMQDKRNVDEYKNRIDI